MTRQKIKKAALKLFAQRGLEGVSVRDINKASGQRNAGSINYHFSSRDDLIREIMMDVGKILDEDHLAKIEALEAEGAEITLRDIAKILVTPTIADPVDPETCAHSLRFLQMAMLSHRDMMMEAMEGNNPGLDRCLDHVRALAPEMPEDLLEQRIKLGMKFLLMAGSAREQALQYGDAHDPHVTAVWAADNVADAFTGIISAPVAQETLACFDADDPKEAATG